MELLSGEEDDAVRWHVGIATATVVRQRLASKGMRKEEEEMELFSGEEEGAVSRRVGSRKDDGGSTEASIEGDANGGGGNELFSPEDDKIWVFLLPSRQTDMRRERKLGYFCHPPKI